MKFVLVTQIGAIVALLVAPPASARSLQEELADLLKYHPQIEASRKSVGSSGEGINRALSGYYPTVSVNGEIGPTIIDNPTTRARAANVKDQVRTKNIAGLTVAQNLFKGFATSSLTKTARLNKEISEISLENTVQNVLFEAISAYIDVLRQKRLVELSQSSQDTIQTQLSLEDERVNRGSGIAVDVLQAKSRLQIAKERRVNFEGGLEDAVSRYRQVFNIAPDIDAMMDPMPPVELLPSDLASAINIALDENPAISNANATIEVARERQRTVKSEYYPSVDLVAEANYEKHDDTTIGTRRDYSLVLEANWALFSGFSTRAGAAQAAYDYGSSKDNHTFVVRKVEEQTRLSWQALLTVRDRVDLLENAVNIASEVFDARGKLREAGKETVINVLDAESEIFNAQINYTAASYDERVAVYQLLLAMGRLNAQNLGMAAR